MILSNSDGGGMVGVMVDDAGGCVGVVSHVLSLMCDGSCGTLTVMIGVCVVVTLVTELGGGVETVAVVVVGGVVAGSAVVEFPRLASLVVGVGRGVEFVEIDRVVVVLLALVAGLCTASGGIVMGVDTVA